MQQAMKTFLDCLPCLIRQAVEAAKMATNDPAVHDRLVRQALKWAAEMDFDLPPPVLAQRIHRKLREITGVFDPYQKAKTRANEMALALVPQLRIKIEVAVDPLFMAARLAAAGNVIDMGASGNVGATHVRRAVEQALTTPLAGDWKAFVRALSKAQRILYLADNAGEIVFDRLFIERLGPERVTLAVRGAPVINDATRADAKAADLHSLVDIIDNGTDAPGTILEACTDDFIRRFNEADLIIAKGQGNFETLSASLRPVYFLFMVKCAVVSRHTGHPKGTHLLLGPQVTDLAKGG